MSDITPPDKGRYGAPSPAERAALMFLDGNRGHYRSAISALRRYYAGNGHLTGHASAGRRGAAARMLYRLEERGWVTDDGWVTVAGRAALAETEGGR